MLPNMAKKKKNYSVVQAEELCGVCDSSDSTWTWWKLKKQFLVEDFVIEVEMNQIDFLLEECYKGASNIKNDSLVFKPLPCGLSLILQHKLALGTTWKGFRACSQNFW